MDNYRLLLERTAKHPLLLRFLRIVDIISVLVTVAALLAALLQLGTSNLYLTLGILLTTGIPFVLVSLARAIINAPRPHEVYGRELVRTGEDNGCSFPSRHAFSSFSIGTALVFVYPLVGTVVLLFGGVLALSRVLTGRHFPTDVIAGALIGMATSTLGMLLTILI